MNMKTGMKQVVTFALAVLVLIVVIPMLKNSLKPTPGIETNIGETFTVTLKSDANIDYHWDLLASGDGMVEVVTRPEGREAIAATEVWTFHALTAGKASLYFGYVRYDDSTRLAVRTETVLVTIKP